MKKFLGVVTAAVAALALMSQAADAGPRKHRHHHHHHHHHIDKRVKIAGAVTGIASTVAFFELTDWSWNNSWNQRHESGVTTAGAYALTTVGCIAVAPFVATAIVRRPLTYREVHTMSANCVLPILGGLLVSAAYDRNPSWERFDAPARPARMARHKKRR